MISDAFLCFKRSMISSFFCKAWYKKCYHEATSTPDVNSPCHAPHESWNQEQSSCLPRFQNQLLKALSSAASFAETPICMAASFMETPVDLALSAIWSHGISSIFFCRAAPMSSVFFCRAAPSSSADMTGLADMSSALKTYQWWIRAFQPRPTQKRNFETL